MDRTTLALNPVNTTGFARPCAFGHGNAWLRSDCSTATMPGAVEQISKRSARWSRRRPT